MIVTFKSRASSDIIMLGSPAKELLAVIGKDPQDTKGIVTVPQLPEAIERLRVAIEEDRVRQAAREKQQEEGSDDEPAPTGMAAPVGLAQRGWPLLTMMQVALKEDVPVVWEV